ncbi:hypothetical protein OGAPHI_000101 [Ogataea philodendri]|uniref:Uncharacterized protein n=1 Tax=Ogataea philodendri TaxID=1378263 RepID=A0A9P8TB15_9ASCO|nr:uncharacterized protein OGAPHI_000101 [Ogataea philodendri]KAH3671915.1 hypothetical protein OGAPHI_000101 [Ogataea philodendri]
MLRESLIVSVHHLHHSNDANGEGDTPNNQDDEEESGQCALTITDGAKIATDCTTTAIIELGCCETWSELLRWLLRTMILAASPNATHDRNRVKILKNSGMYELFMMMSPSQGFHSFLFSEIQKPACDRYFVLSYGPELFPLDSPESMYDDSGPP